MTLSTIATRVSEEQRQWLKEESSRLAISEAALISQCVQSAMTSKAARDSLSDEIREVLDRQVVATHGKLLTAMDSLVEQVSEHMLQLIADVRNETHESTERSGDFIADVIIRVLQQRLGVTSSPAPSEPSGFKRPAPRMPASLPKS